MPLIDRLATLVLSASLLSTLGCASMKDSWRPYETSDARLAELRQQAQKGDRDDEAFAAIGGDVDFMPCHTPLRVAVVPFADKRVGRQAFTGPLVASAIGGFVMQMPASGVNEWDAAMVHAQFPMFVHDERRVYAMELYHELVASKCFESVAFDPEDPSQYDLVFSGTILRFAIKTSLPLVPLPLYIGTMASLIASSRQAVFDMEMTVSAPYEAPAIRYGLESSCNGKGCDGAWNNADAFQNLLRRGYAGYMRHLRSYFASRTTAQWEQLAALRKPRFYARFDPELVALEREVAASPEGPRRDVLAKFVERKTLALEAMRLIDEAEEASWAETSDERIKRENSANNAQVDQIFSERLRAAILTAGAQAVTGVSQIRAGHGFTAPDLTKMQQAFDKNLQTVQKVDRIWKGVAEQLGVMTEGRDDLKDLLAQFAGITGQRKERHASWMVLYGKGTGTLATAIAEADRAAAKPARPARVAKPARKAKHRS